MKNRLPPVHRFTTPTPTPDTPTPAAGSPPNVVRTKVPAYPFVAVQDTREQKPYTLPCPTIRKALKTGDYSIEGMEHRITLERKQIGELFGCFGRERDRWRREWIRMAQMEFAAVIIEGNLEDVLCGDSRSSVPPSVVIGSLVSWAVRYGVSVWFAGDRARAQSLVLALLSNFHRHHGAAPAITRWVVD